MNTNSGDDAEIPQSQIKFLEDEIQNSLEKDFKHNATHIHVTSVASGCLFRYTKTHKLKSGLVVEYPHVCDIRDFNNPKHWYWGYCYKVKDEDDDWKFKALSVKLSMVTTVRAAIECNVSIGAIIALIKGDVSTALTVEKEFLEEKLPFSLEKKSASGSLYHYIKDQKLKSGLTATYPRVEVERDPNNFNHWYWGYSYEVFVGGEWRSRTLSVPKSKVAAVQSMIANNKPVEEIKKFIQGR
ncbi:C-5 cytosine-specific DNA methylase (plasmid) [Calothrix sp. NIES-4071]|nr:C-5 cytosine-specific DNA methylase [Calothrix sp. NIES-4071]BAZ64391.1 C-5 cytosine-specific DNA methylase [Calothrix sp. NIES-4105]